MSAWQKDTMNKSHEGKMLHQDLVWLPLKYYKSFPLKN